MKQVMNYMIRLDDKEWEMSNCRKEKNVLKKVTTESET